eukprot:6182553-Amphidinium_carterae.1
MLFDVLFCCSAAGAAAAAIHWGFSCPKDALAKLECRSSHVLVHSHIQIGKIHSSTMPARSWKCLLTRRNEKRAPMKNENHIQRSRTQSSALTDNVGLFSQKMEARRMCAT